MKAEYEHTNLIARNRQQLASSMRTSSAAFACRRSETCQASDWRKERPSGPPASSPLPTPPTPKATSSNSKAGDDPPSKPDEAIVIFEQYCKSPEPGCCLLLCAVLRCSLRAKEA